MIAVDTSALMAIILGEPARDDFIAVLDRAEAVIISSGTLIETLLVARRRGDDALVARVEALVEAFGMAIAAPGPADIAAALAGHARYGKGTGHPAQLNFGDLFAYALATSRDVPLLFKGEDFAATDVRAAT